MGYLLHILMAVTAQAAAASDLGRPLIGAAWGLAFPPLIQLAARRARRANLAGRFRTAGRSTGFVHRAPPLMFALLALGTDWMELVRSWTGAQLSITSWPELALGLAFAPYVLLQLLAIDAEARVHAAGRRERRHMRAFQGRMFLSGLLPILLYVLFSAAVGALPVLRAHVEQVALLHALFLVALLGALVLAMPALLANTWETELMPVGPQRELLEAVGRRAGFRARAVRVWRTGNLMANAAIVGVGPRKVVLFSDSLLAMLGLRELAAVYAHEIGHSKRHHVAVFMAWALASFLAGDLLADWIAPQDDLLGTGILVATLALWALGFGWLSRRCELEADLYSLELLGDPEAMVSALERVGGRLRDVAGWRHFSTTDRVAFLWRAITDPDMTRRFVRRLRGIAWFGGGLLLALSGLELAGMVERLPEDRFRADLALGRYARALERAERAQAHGDPLDGDLVELGELGREVVGDRPAREHGPALEQALIAALDGGALPRAGRCATLLLVRGRGDLLPVLEALEALEALRARDDDPGPAARAALEAALEAVPPPWREHLAPRTR